MEKINPSIGKQHDKERSFSNNRNYIKIDRKFVLQNLAFCRNLTTTEKINPSNEKHRDKERFFSNNRNYIKKRSKIFLLRNYLCKNLTTMEKINSSNGKHRDKERVFSNNPNYIEKESKIYLYRNLTTIQKINPFLSFNLSLKTIRNKLIFSRNIRVINFFMST